MGAALNGEGWSVNPDEVIEFIRRNCRVQYAGRGKHSIPIKPNRGQVGASQTRPMRLEGGWLVTIKGRQVGFSTWMLCWSIALMVLYPGVKIAFVAPDDVISGPIKKKWRIIWQSVAAMLGNEFPGVVVNNDGLFELDNGSNIVWASAGATKEKATKAGIGDTFDLLILSELAKWPWAQVTIEAIDPALEGGSVVVDSTAPDQDGMGATYLEIATDALSGADPDSEAYFIPWWWIPHYRKSTPARGLTDEERALMAAHPGEIDAFQIEWRRRKKAGKAGAKFHVIYPETPQDALVSQGDSAFAAEVITRLRQKTFADFEPPLDSMRVHELLESVQWSPSSRSWAHTTKPSGLTLAARLPGSDQFCQPLWAPNTKGSYRGHVRIWQPPQAGVRYWLGLDSSEGRDMRADHQALAVLDEWGTHCAQIRVRVSEMLLASHVARMFWLYDTIGESATLEVEMMNYGPTVVFLLKSVPSEDEIKIRRAHMALQKVVPASKIIERTATGGARESRKSAFVDYYDSGHEVRDIETATEILNLDPKTLEKFKRRGASDDNLDSIGIASDSRRRSTYAPRPVASAIRPTAIGRPKRGPSKH